MKNKFYLKLFFIATMIISLSCDKDEQETFNSYDGSLGALVSFANTNYELSIPTEDLEINVPVNVSSSSASERTFNVAVSNATANTENEYAIGSIVIPANSYSGNLNIAFDFSEIGGADGEVKDLAVKIQDQNDISTYSDEITITYFREIVCNDLELTIISDVWATETYFTLESKDGTVIVDRFFPFTGNSTQPQEYNVSFNLPDGDYVFKMGDVFGDGQVGTGGGVTLIGSYELKCSIITHASGDGAFNNVADPFGPNTDATVEVTEFSVNP